MENDHKYYSQYTRANGSIRISAYPRVDGVRLTGSVTCHPKPTQTKEEVQKKVEELASLLIADLIKEYEDKKKGNLIGFNEYCETVFLAPTNTHYKEGTRGLNEAVIRKCFKDFFGDIALRDITNDMIQEAVSLLKMKENENREDPVPIAPQTVERYVTVLRGVFAKAVSDGILHKNPFDERKLDLDTIYYPLVVCLDDYDYKKILEDLCAKVESHQLEKIDVIVAIGLLAGLRRGEIVALRWKDVRGLGRETYEGVLISVNHSAYKPKGKPQKLGTPKTPKSIREFAILEVLACILETWKKIKESDGIPVGDDNFIISNKEGQMVSIYSPTRWFHKYLEKHELADVKLHSLRHTFASILINQRIDPFHVRDIMGHEEISTTEIYVHSFRMKSPALLKPLNDYNSKFLKFKKGKENEDPNNSEGDANDKVK